VILTNLRRSRRDSSNYRPFYAFRFVCEHIPANMCHILRYMEFRQFLNSEFNVSQGHYLEVLGLMSRSCKFFY